MFFKRLSLVAAICTTLFAQAAYSDETLAPENRRSRVQTLASLCGEKLNKQIMAEVTLCSYVTLDSIKERFNTEESAKKEPWKLSNLCWKLSDLIFGGGNKQKRSVSTVGSWKLSNLVFGKPYRCQLNELNQRFMPYLQEINLSMTNLGAYLEINRDGLTSLKACQLLRELNVSCNNLAVLGEDLRLFLDIKSLRALYIGSNNLRGHVRHLTGNTDLLALDLGHNHLGEHIHHIAGLTNLRALDVNSNELVGQVQHLVGLNNLTFLDVSGNDLEEQHVLLLADLMNGGTRVIHQWRRGLKAKLIY